MASQTVSSRDEERLRRYFGGESKYDILPVPTPVDRATAIQFVLERLSGSLGVRGITKLRRVSDLHDLEETAPGYMTILNKLETSGDDVARSAQAIVAITWSGTDAHKADAHRYFHSLLRRSKPDRDQKAVFLIFDAMGPKENLDRFKKWCDDFLEVLETEKKECEARSNTSAVESLKIRISNIEKYRDNSLEDLEAGLTMKKEILDLKSADTQNTKLVDLYVNDEYDTDAGLAYWAAMTMVRLARHDPNRGARFAEGCQKRATEYSADGGKLKATYDVRRARALRAAQFFGGHLNEADAAWLATQTDYGTDELALRPDWKYPNPVKQ